MRYISTDPVRVCAGQLSGMRRVAAADAAAVAGSETRPDLRQVAEVLRQRNDALRQNVTQLLRLRERGTSAIHFG